MPRWLERTSSACGRFVGQFPKRHPKLKSAITAVIVGLPPSVLGLATIKLFASTPQWQADLQAHLSANSSLVIALVAWPLLANFLTGVAGDYLKRYADGERAEEEQMVTLLAALDDVEGRKLNRFAEFAVKAEADPELAKQVFLQITRPGKQIERLIGTLHNVLTHLTGDASLEIVLARIENGLPVQWRCQMPNDVVLPDSLLGQGGEGTVFALAARVKKTIYVEDIESELAKKKKGEIRYVAVGDPEQDKGSIMCRPLYSSALRRMMYVLSIKSMQHKAIAKPFGKKFTVVFDAFCTRLLLEAHLEVLRKLALAGGIDEDE